MHSTIKYIKNKIKSTPEIGIILGSGLTEFTSRINKAKELKYTNVPGMPTPSVKGHGGSFIFGEMGGKEVVCASGRFHMYEGLSLEKVSLPVKIFNNLGVKTVIITNSSGCLRRNWEIGSFMIITSAIDFTFRDGSDDPLPINITGNKFDELMKLAHFSSGQLGIHLNEGCYVWTPGPTYETHAEVKKIDSLNGGAVGMSTLPEIRAAIESGMSVLGIACLTNYAAGIQKSPLTHQEVVDKAGKSAKSLSDIIERIINNCNMQI